jgi:ABC-type dipeptide/oligopeptide/nickel transport system ATPase component
MMIDKKLSIVFVWKTLVSTSVLDILNANNHYDAAQDFMSNNSKHYMVGQNDNAERISRSSIAFFLQNDSLSWSPSKEGRFINLETDLFRPLLAS